MFESQATASSGGRNKIHWDQKIEQHLRINDYDWIFFISHSKLHQFKAKYHKIEAVNILTLPFRSFSQSYLNIQLDYVLSYCKCNVTVAAWKKDTDIYPLYRGQTRKLNIQILRSVNLSETLRFVFLRWPGLSYRFYFTVEPPSFCVNSRSRFICYWHHLQFPQS